MEIKGGSDLFTCRGKGCLLPITGDKGLTAWRKGLRWGEGRDAIVEVEVGSVYSVGAGGFKQCL